MTKKRLGKVLRERGHLSTADLNQILLDQRGKRMRLMHEYALEHLLQGLTTVEEVQSVVPFEEVAAVNCASCLRELSPSFAFCSYCGEKRMIQ